MPNHVTNKVEITSSNAEEALAFIKGDETAFDFNNVIPMPAQLNIESSSTAEHAFVYQITDGFKRDLTPIHYRKFFGSVFNPYSDWAQELSNAKNHIERWLSGEDKTKEFEDFKTLGKQMEDNYNAYGCGTWYEWCPKNWGTKWNAYEVKTTENSVEFDTAWNSPTPVLEKWISQFKLTCTVKAFDEGYNFWFIKEYKDGELQSERDSLPEDRDALALELKGYTQDDEEEE